MSSPPANIASFIVLAGFGFAGGVTILINYLTNTDSEEEPRGNELSASRRQSKPESLRLRAISPPRQPPARFPAASTSERRNGDHKWRGEIRDCPICGYPMSVSRIQLECSHTFHDKCYTVWRHRVVMRNPHAKLCPSC